MNMLAEWIYFALIAMATIFLNAMIIAMYFKRKAQQRKPSFTLLCSQAFADLLTGSILILAIAKDPTQSHRLTPYVVCFVFFSGLINKNIIAYDRYMATTQPLKYRVMITNGKVRLMIVLSWCASIFLTMVPLTWEYTAAVEIIRFKSGFAFFLSILILMFTTVTAFMYVITHIRVMSYFRNKELMIKEYQESETIKKTALFVAKKRRQAFMKFIALAAVLALCYIPVIYINIQRQFESQQMQFSNDSILKISLYMFLSCALLNPLLSLWHMKEIRLTKIIPMHCVILGYTCTRDILGRLFRLKFSDSAQSIRLENFV